MRQMLVIDGNSRVGEAKIETMASVMAERDRLREALEKIASVSVHPKAEVGSYLQAIANEALKG